MNFLNPLGFIGLISIPLILAMYLFKPKATDKVISSTYLWEKSLKVSQISKPWQKLVKDILLFLQILIALLLVLGLTKPYFLMSSKTSDSVIILDATMSMQTLNEKNVSRFEEAKEIIKEKIQAMNNDDTISLVILNNNPYVLSNYNNNKKELISKLDTASVTNSSFNKEKSVSIIETLTNEKEANIILVTDDNSITLDNIKTQNILVGDSIGNTSISLISYKFENDNLVLLTKIKNDSFDKIINSLTIFCDDKILNNIEFEIEPNSEKEIFVEDLPINTKKIEAKLSKHDNLSLDDVAYTIVSTDNLHKAIVFTEQNIFLENALNIMPNIELYKGDINNLEQLKGYYIYIFDGILPSELPKDGHILIFNPPKENNIIDTLEDIEIKTSNFETTDGFNYIDNLDFYIKDIIGLEYPTWANEKIYNNDNIIGISGNIMQQKVVVFGFDLHNTDLPLKKDFPIFIYDTLNIFNINKMNNISNLVVDESVYFDIMPNASTASVTLPNGESIPLAPPFPIEIFTDTGQKGIYTLVQNVEDSGVYNSFGVNVFNPIESNLLREEASQQDLVVTSNETMINQYYNNILIFLAIIVVVAEWWLYNRGI